MEDKNISIVIQDENSSFGKTEEFKRSDHNDFATSKELKDREFSGVRLNSITSRREVWVVGEKIGEMDNREAEANEAKWESFYKDLFDML